MDTYEILIRFIDGKKLFVRRTEWKTIIVKNVFTVMLNHRYSKIILNAYQEINKYMKSWNAISEFSKKQKMQKII